MFCEQRKISMALAAAGNPDIIFLDGIYSSHYPYENCSFCSLWLLPSLSPVQQHTKLVQSQALWFTTTCHGATGDFGTEIPCPCCNSRQGWLCMGCMHYPWHHSMSHHKQCALNVLTSSILKTLMDFFQP